MILDRFFKYQTANLWQSEKLRDNIGAYIEKYSLLGSINISRLEPVQGTTFDLVDRGEIITGGYKIYTLAPVKIGYYLELKNGFYRVNTCNNWNNQYYELYIELLPGVNPNG